MKFDRVKQILKKVNALIENLDDQGETSAIERDLLLRYLRDLYEDVSRPNVTSDPISIAKDITPTPVPEKSVVKEDNPVVAPTHEPVAQSDQVEIESVLPSDVMHHPSAPEVKNVTSESQTTFYDAGQTSEPKSTILPEEAPHVTQPNEAVINTFENPVQYFPPTEEPAITTTTPELSRYKTNPSPLPNADPLSTADPIPHDMPAPQNAVLNTEPQVSTAASTEVAPGRFDSVFVEKSGTDVADKFQLQRVVTIEGAMGINERMQTTNELFGGEHNLFMETVTQINNLTDFESARKYLIQGPATRFNWDADERQRLASEFVQLVRRKFA